jgi:hypothetical protein
MTFTEKLYEQIDTISPLSTDDFSIEWLGQSRSYYSSNKARGYEASNKALVKLMNKLIERKDALTTKNSNKILPGKAREYEMIALSVGQEIANRSIRSNIANSSVKKILHRIIVELNEQANPSHPPIIIC